MLLGHDPVRISSRQAAARRSEVQRDARRKDLLLRERRAPRPVSSPRPRNTSRSSAAFCTNGVTYGVKLSSDPTEFEIIGGKLYIFGDVLGHEYWLLERTRTCRTRTRCGPRRRTCRGSSRR
jgi:hypothetical protein